MRNQQYKLVMNSVDVFEWICTVRIIFPCQVLWMNYLEWDTANMIGVSGKV